LRFTAAVIDKGLQDHNLPLIAFAFQQARHFKDFRASHTIAKEKAARAAANSQPARTAVFIPACSPVCLFQHQFSLGGGPSDETVAAQHSRG
jgi:hypothetical protein